MHALLLLPKAADLNKNCSFPSQIWSKCQYFSFCKLGSTYKNGNVQVYTFFLIFFCSPFTFMVSSFKICCVYCSISKKILRLLNFCCSYIQSSWKLRLLTLFWLLHWACVWNLESLINECTYNSCFPLLQPGSRIYPLSILCAYS